MKVRLNSSEQRRVLTKSVTTSSSGTTPVITPSSGNAIRLYWYSLAANPSNSATVTGSLRWTTGGTDFVSVPLSQYGSIFSHSFRAGESYVQGAVNEALVMNLSAAQAVTCNIDYDEVTP